MYLIYRQIYEKINKPQTKEVGYELFLEIMNKNLYSSSQMNFIINHIGEFIAELTPKKRSMLITIIINFYPPSNEDESFDTKIYFQYLSLVLSIYKI